MKGYSKRHSSVFIALSIIILLVLAVAGVFLAVAILNSDLPLIWKWFLLK